MALLVFNKKMSNLTFAQNYRFQFDTICFPVRQLAEELCNSKVAFLGCIYTDLILRMWFKNDSLMLFNSYQHLVCTYNHKNHCRTVSLMYTLTNPCESVLFCFIVNSSILFQSMPEVSCDEWTEWTQSNWDHLLLYLHVLLTRTTHPTPLKGVSEPPGKPWAPAGSLA